MNIRELSNKLNGIEYRVDINKELIGSTIIRLLINLQGRNLDGQGHRLVKIGFHLSDTWMN